MILGDCNPSLAHRALTIAPQVGLLLPCNVIVYEKNKDSVVEILDPIRMMDVTENPDLELIAKDAQLRLLRVINQLGA